MKHAYPDIAGPVLKNMCQEHVPGTNSGFRGAYTKVLSAPRFGMASSPFCGHLRVGSVCGTYGMLSSAQKAIVYVQHRRAAVPIKALPSMHATPTPTWRAGTVRIGLPGSSAKQKNGQSQETVL